MIVEVDPGESNGLAGDVVIAATVGGRRVVQNVDVALVATPSDKSGSSP